MIRSVGVLVLLAGCSGATQALAQTRTVTCSSDDGAYHTCTVAAGGAVRLIRQLSGSPCRQNQTWGYSGNRIWVDRGCRAEFEVSTAYTATSGPTSVVHCQSDDEKRHYCPADTSGGVSVLRQLSGSRCDEGRGWGYDSGGIWVDRGCRADFETRTATAGGGTPKALTCSSDDGKRRVCPADTTGGVRLVRQLSGSPCDQGRGWGYDASGVWVDRGCRAEFEALSAAYAGSGTASVVTCSSDDGRRHVCPADTAGGVRVVRQLSGSACDQGRGWGYDASGIWVDHGCRAEFEARSVARVGYRQQEQVNQVNVISCSSDDGGRHVCSADTTRGVRLVRQISGSACTQGQTWGYDSNGIWVDRGCRAEFETGYAGSLLNPIR